ncbi:MAG: 6-bladed beta-propeller [Bacteroidales bacterium]|nr:6-bladed beta-propeller [Bacteroidales bacterium]
MKPNQILFLTIWSLIIVSCSPKSKTKDFQSVTTLNIEKAITQSQAVDVNALFKKIEFIPLETNDEALLGDVLKIRKHKGFYYLYDNTGNLFRFDTEGKFMNRIGAIGNGPEEYNTITDFTIDMKNDLVVVNSLGKLICFTIEGKFVKSLRSGVNEQVLDMDDTGRIFYILPDKVQPANVTSAEVIKVLAPDGSLIKTFNTAKIRHSGLSVFNQISQKNGTMYYKEEMGHLIYAINPNLEKDSIYDFNLGKYAFKEMDFEMSAKKKWESLYRLDKILITDKFTCFNLQNGLIGKNICPLFWNGKGLVFPHSEEDSSKKGLFINGIKITPMAESNNEIICLASLVDILEKKKSDNLKFESLNNITEASNPVLCILK